MRKQIKINASIYPIFMSCGAGSSVYSVVTLPLSTIKGTVISVDNIELRGERTSGAGFIDTFSGYTYPFKKGSSTEPYAQNFTAATIMNWINQYGLSNMAVHLGFRAEGGSGIGTYYGNIYCSITLTYETGSSTIYYYDGSDFVPCTVYRYVNGQFVECQMSYYTGSTWYDV